MVTSGERGGKGNTGVREQEVQTTECKTGYKDILYNMGNIVSGNNCKWKVTLKIAYIFKWHCETKKKIQNYFLS